MNQADETPEQQEAQVKKQELCDSDRHEGLLGMRDAIDVLSGKWKIPLIGTLIFNGSMRFSDLQRQMKGIGAKMLSKELQDLEMHRLVQRTVKATKPITVEYAITDYGRSLEPVIIAISHWGLAHRRKMMKDDPV